MYPVAANRYPMSHPFQHTSFAVQPPSNAKANAFLTASCWVQTTRATPTQSQPPLPQATCKQSQNYSKAITATAQHEASHKHSRTQPQASGIQPFRQCHCSYKQQHALHAQSGGIQLGAGSDIDTLCILLLPHAQQAQQHAWLQTNTDTPSAAMLVVTADCC